MPTREVREAPATLPAPAEPRQGKQTPRKLGVIPFQKLPVRLFSVVALRWPRRFLPLVPPYFPKKPHLPKPFSRLESADLRSGAAGKRRGRACALACCMQVPVSSCMDPLTQLHAQTHGYLYLHLQSSKVQPLRQFAHARVHACISAQLPT